MDEIFVIVLDRDKIRKEYVKEIIKKNKLSAKIFSAIDGSQLTKHQLDKYVKNNYIDAEFQDKLTTGELGCALSHVKLWEMMIEKNLDQIMILEDDFMLGNNFQEKFYEFKSEHYFVKKRLLKNIFKS